MWSFTASSEKQCRIPKDIQRYPSHTDYSGHSVLRRSAKHA